MTLLRDAPEQHTSENPALGGSNIRPVPGEQSTGERESSATRSFQPRPHPQPVPRWAAMASAIWVAVSLGYILAYGGITPSPWVIGGIIAGISTPLLVIWLVALMEMRSMEVDHLTGPVRRQLTALLAPGMAAENRVRRVTQLLSDQAEQLRQAAGIALEDSSAAMNALSRQSGELRRMSAEAMLELGRVGKSAEQTLKHLQDALAQLNTQTGGEREKALALVTELEKHTRSVMAEVEALSASYEDKLSKLNDTSTQLESRARSLVDLTEGVDVRIDAAANGSIRDISRLEEVVAELAQRSAAIAHQLQRPVSSLEGAAQHLDRNMRQSQEMLDSSTANLSKIGDTVLGRATSLVENLSDRLSSLELVGAKLVSVGAAAQADTGRYVAQIEAAADRMRDQTEHSHVQLREMLGEYERLSLDGTRHTEATVDRLQSGAENLTLALNQSESRFDQLIAAVDERSDRLTAAGKSATASLEYARTVLDGAQDSFASQLERLSGLSTLLGTEIAKAEAGTVQMAAANQTAHERANGILAAGEDTRALLDTITGVLTEQQSSVRDLSASIAAQVDALTATLVVQRSEIVQAAATVTETSAESRATLTGQLAAIGQATLDAGAMLDRLNGQIEAQTAGVAAVADRVDARLHALVANVQAELEGFSNSNDRIEEEQRTLADLIERADRHMAGFNTRLVEAQQHTVTTMDSVADRLAALRGEVERTGQMLGAQGETVHQQHGLLTSDATATSASMDVLLSRMTSLTDGLGSAGLAVEAQGQAATALMGQAEQALAASASRLLSEQQTAGMALAEIARELSRQQQQLEALQASTAQMSSALTAQSDDVAASLSGVTARMEASADVLKLRSVESRHSIDDAADRFEQTTTVLESGARSGIAIISAAEAALVGAGQTSEARAEALARQLRDMQDEMAAVQLGLASLSKEGEKVSLELYEQSERAATATAAIDAAGARAVAAGESLENKIGEISAAATVSDQRTAETLANLQAALGDMQKASQKGDNLLSEAAAQLELATSVLNENTLSAENKLNGATQGLRLAASEIGERLATAQASLALASAGLGDEAVSANAHVQSLQAEISGLQAALESLGHRSDQLSGAIAQQASRAEQSATQIEAATTKADAASRQLQGRMAELGEMGAQQQRVLAELGEAIIDTQKSLETSGNKTEDKLRSMLGSLAEAGEKADGAVAQIIERLAGAGTRIGTETAEAEQQLSAASEILRRVSNEFAERLTNAETRLGEARAGLLQTGSAVEAQIITAESGVRGLTDTMTDAESALSRSSRQVAHLSDEVGNALGTLLADIERLDVQGGEHATHIEKLSSQISAQIERVGEVGAQQQRILADLGEAIIGTQKSLEVSGSQSEEQLRQMHSELAEVSGKADAAVVQIIERLAGAGTRISTETAAAEQQLASAGEILRSASDEFAERISAAEARLAEARSGMLETGSAVETRISAAESGVRTLTGTAAEAEGALSRSSQQVARLAAEVGTALGTLLADIERLDVQGRTHTTHLEEMGGRIGSQLERVGEAGGMAVARQEQLLSTLVKAQESFGDIGLQVDSVRDIVSRVTDHASARLTAVSLLLDEQTNKGSASVEAVANRLQQSGDVAREQVALIENVAERVEQRLTSAVTAVESRRSALMQATDSTLMRLDMVNEGFADTVSRTEAVQSKLFADVQQNEHLLSGLATLSESTTETLERTGQRMAMLAQQAAQDSTRMSGVAERIEQQQSAIRHSAEAAVAVLQSVQAQMMKSGGEGVDLIEASEARMSDVLVAMTERMASLSQQNEAMMQQFGEMVERFTTSTNELQQNSHLVGSELLDITGQMHTRALDMTAAGQQFDRELKSRLGSLDETKGHLQGYFDGFGRELAAIDSRTNTALIDLDRRSSETFGKLQHGVERLAALPEAMETAQGLLNAQVEAARAEIARLRSDLLDIGQQVEISVNTASGSAGHLLSNMRDIGTQSRVSAAQLDEASHQLITASQQAWDMIGQAAGAGGDNLSALLNTLGGARDQLGNITDVARSSIETLLERIYTLNQLVEGSLSNLSQRYHDVTRDGFGSFEKLSGLLDTGVNRLEAVSTQARNNLSGATEQLARHQDMVTATAQTLGERLSGVTVQLEALRDGLSGLEARLEFVEPAFGSQQSRLESFLGALDRTLNQVASLQSQAKTLSHEHLDLANQVQEQESRMLSLAKQLEGSLGHVDGQLSGSILVRLQQALEQAQQADSHLDRLSSQATRMDGVLGHLRTSLQEDVRALEFAENGINTVAERSTGKMLEVGTALNATLGQLQKGSQLSQAGLLQANEETQRLVVRLEQVRALIKNMMGAIGSDLTEWQSDLKRRLTGLANEVAEQASRNARPVAAAAPVPAPVVALPPLPPSLGQSLRIAPVPASEVTSVPNTGQLAAQALHAMAIDLYRLLHTEIPELGREMMPPAARRQPMTPEDARAYTRTMLDQRPETLRAHMRHLYQTNAEFKQYVDRYLLRFEAQYDLVVRGTDGVTLATRWRQGEVGQLYLLLAKAVERRSAAAGAMV